MKSYLRSQNWQLSLYISLAIFILAIPILLIPNDWMGYLLFYLSFLILFLSKKIRKNQRYFIFIALSLSFHHAIAFYNSYFGTVSGGVADPETFHKTAVDLAAFASYLPFSVGHKLYINLLSLMYQAFGASKLLGHEFSVLMYSISCIFFVELIHSLHWQRFQVRLILLYGLLPSAIIHRSLTQRESLQSLFFLLSAYCIIKLRQKPKFNWIASFFMSSICLGLLHHGLLLYAVFLMIFGLYLALNTNNRKNGLKNKLFWAFIVLGVCTAWFALAGSTQYGASQVLLSGDIEYIESYQNYNTDSRASYGATLDTSSWFGIIRSLPLAYIHYLFAPFPWQVATSVDIYAFVEAIFRLVLILSALRTWYKLSGQQKSNHAFLMISVLSVELLWCVGTKNWGTAIRHHVMSYSILIAIGGPGLSTFINGLFPKRQHLRNNSY